MSPSLWQEWLILYRCQYSWLLLHPLAESAAPGLCSPRVVVLVSLSQQTDEASEQPGGGRGMRGTNIQVFTYKSLFSRRSFSGWSRKASMPYTRLLSNVMCSLQVLYTNDLVCRQLISLFSSQCVYIVQLQWAFTFCTFVYKFDKKHQVKRLYQRDPGSIELNKNKIHENKTIKLGYKKEN